ncbi:MAG TPA: PTS sugar transporter subunit IIB [Clostridium sp.]
MLKILMVCGAGLGSSFACEMTVESVLKDLNVTAKLEHSDVTSVAGSRADIIISATNFEKLVSRYETTATKIFLKRLVDKTEIREKLVPVLKEKGEL